MNVCKSWNKFCSLGFFLFVFFFLFFGVYNRTMTLPTWEHLAKNQEDAEKIEEAITRKIEEHEADPTAHLGEGESIELHRTDPMLDHKAGSVVPDKLSYKAREATTFFDSLNGWETQGSVFNRFLALNVPIFGNQSQDAYAWIDTVVIAPVDDFVPGDGYIQFKASFTKNTDIGTAYVGLGVQDEVPSYGNILCFRFSGDNVSVGVALEDSISWYSVGSLAFSNHHVYRIETLEETGFAYFYIDGVEVYSVDVSTMDNAYFASFGVYMEKTGGTTNAHSTLIALSYLTHWNRFL